MGKLGLGFFFLFDKHTLSVSRMKQVSQVAGEGVMIPYYW